MSLRAASMTGGARLPVISVVIPVRDPARDFVATLRCVVATSVRDAGIAEIIVVDDGSTRGSEWLDDAAQLPGVRVLRLPQQAGRAGARDAGARAATGDWVWFLDADCVPRDNTLDVHVAALHAGADASLGLVDVRGGGFWDRYQATVLAARARAPADEQSIANCLLRRYAYLALGGLDTAYCGYGFEDRDFLLRAQAAGWRLQCSPDAVAEHAGDVTLASVCAKFNEAARLTAPRFAAQHPAHYRRMKFGRIDPRQRGLVMAALLACAAACFPWLFVLAGACVAAERLPQAPRALLVRVVVALAYVRGCRGQAFP